MPLITAIVNAVWPEPPAPAPLWESHSVAHRSSTASHIRDFDHPPVNPGIVPDKWGGPGIWMPGTEPTSGADPYQTQVIRVSIEGLGGGAGGGSVTGIGGLVPGMGGVRRTSALANCLGEASVAAACRVVTGTEERDSKAREGGQPRREDTVGEANAATKRRALLAPANKERGDDSEKQDDTAALGWREERDVKKRSVRAMREFLGPCRDAPAGVT
mmetsp:Transcript_18432/g.46041  ORF Transcript_18432/g.46041 Transcript_18432/m.46041 type:complete len:216 (-) Transcript_18432:409-1056(-)